ncbi:hypothetical protein GFM29_37685, partial [Rhizobium leguminosarum bv. viciae]|nr:hypothetical protein [Rhizobium leguminosarum bv. viciae]
NLVNLCRKSSFSDSRPRCTPYFERFGLAAALAKGGPFVSFRMGAPAGLPRGDPYHAGLRPSAGQSGFFPFRSAGAARHSSRIKKPSLRRPALRWAAALRLRFRPRPA